MKYIFFRLYWLNTKAASGVPFISAVIAMAFFEISNLIAITELISFYFFSKKNIFGNSGYYILGGIILLLNFIYYFNNNKGLKILNSLKEKYDLKKFNRFDFLVIVYFIISLWLLITPPTYYQN
jgi:hypothetical protein